MPISAQLRLLYPLDWREISDRVKERAHWRCERCGLTHGAYGYRDRRGGWYAVSGYDGLGCEPEHKIIRVVLTVHHIVALADGGSSEDSNLTALCQFHHLALDGPLHARNAAITRARKRQERQGAVGQKAFDLAFLDAPAASPSTPNNPQPCEKG